jgi:uncharacterized membrane protein
MAERTISANRTRSQPMVSALRAAALLAVLAILWQGATAGGILTNHRISFELHEAGAVAVHILTGITALTAFALWRTARTGLWPAVLAAVVFAASFVQAALGDDETMWAHVPGALLLMLGSAVLLGWAWLPKQGNAR